MKLSWGDKATFYSDVSFLWQGGTCFQNNTSGLCGIGKDRPDHDVASLHPLAVVSELYALYNVNEHLNFTLGKKRIVWGPGFAFNPTDILNPPKDPTDWFWSGGWVIGDKIPTGSFTYKVVATDMDGKTHSWSPFNVAASQLTIVDN